MDEKSHAMNLKITWLRTNTFPQSYNCNWKPRSVQWEGAWTIVSEELTKKVMNDIGIKVYVGSKLGAGVGEAIPGRIRVCKSLEPKLNTCWQSRVN